MVSQFGGAMDRDSLFLPLTPLLSCGKEGVKSISGDTCNLTSLKFKPVSDCIELGSGSEDRLASQLESNQLSGGLAAAHGDDDSVGSSWNMSSIGAGGRRVGAQEGRFIRYSDLFAQQSVDDDSCDNDNIASTPLSPDAIRQRQREKRARLVSRLTDSECRRIIDRALVLDGNSEVD